MKTIIGLKELRNDVESYAKQVQKGRSFVVVRRSKPLFKISPVDEWGDDGMWETVVDFRKIDSHGVGADKVLQALKKLRG